MQRWFDTAAVLLFAAATALIGLRAHQSIADGGDRPAALAPEVRYEVRVAAALPHLERHVAAGSMRDRAETCDAEERLAEIAELEATIGQTDDPYIAKPLAEGLAALRQCVACTPEPEGCAAAARAFGLVERRLTLLRVESGI